MCAAGCFPKGFSPFFPKRTSIFATLSQVKAGSERSWHGAPVILQGTILRGRNVNAEIRWLGS